MHLSPTDSQDVPFLAVMPFDLARLVEAMPAGAIETDASARPWSCLNMTQEAADTEVMALEYAQATTGLILALCSLRVDDEGSSPAEKPAPSADVGAP